MSAAGMNLERTDRVTLLDLPLEIRHIIYEHLQYHTAKASEICNILEHHYRDGQGHKGPVLVIHQAHKLDKSRLPQHSLRLRLLLVCRQINREVVDFINRSTDLRAELDLAISGNAVWPTWTLFPILRHREQPVDLKLVWNIHICQVHVDNSRRMVAHITPVQSLVFLLSNFFDTPRTSGFDGVVIRERVYCNMRQVTLEICNRDPYTPQSFLLLLHVVIRTISMKVVRENLADYCDNIVVEYDGKPYNMVVRSHDCEDSQISSKQSGLEDLLASVNALRDIHT